MKPIADYTVVDPVSLLGAVANVLHANGQQTGETLRTITRLAARLGVDARILLSWNTLMVQQRPFDNRTAITLLRSPPESVGMNRVAAASRAVEETIANGRTPGALWFDIVSARDLPPSPDHVFAVACATGAAALALSFGATHLSAIALIFAIAGAGGFVRRTLGRLGANAIAQVFTAALMAGWGGALAVLAEASSDLRLIAVCPCMMLVPGPHVLNGTLDLLNGRTPLGVARLTFAASLIAAITAGLLIGLSLYRVDLPVTPPIRTVDLPVIVIAAAIAAGCFSALFSLPWRLIGWPIIVAMIADAVRWFTITIHHAGPAFSAWIASLIAGALLVPVARRHHIPFAGIGFAAIVSLVPGVLVFRTGGGMLALQGARAQDAPALLQAIVSDASSALAIIVAMAVGILLPKLAFDAACASRAMRAA